MVSNPSNNVKYDSIDEVIIRLLGLQSGLELDYQTYFEIIKKKLAIARLAGKELPREEDELLREELKRVRKIKDTGARFKVRKKKTKISRTPDSTPTPLNQKLIAPAGGLIMGSPKEMLSPKDIIPAKIEDDTKEGRKGYSELTPIQETLDSILDLLKNKFKLSQKVSDQERRDKELEKRSKRESLLEGLKGGISGVVSATRKMLSPLDSIFERIKRFIFFVLLGKAFTKFMEWMSNEENRKKFDSVIEFLADHWPAIAGLYVLFGTSFGRFIRSILKLSARMIVALAVNIPRIIAFIKKNKKLAFLGLAVAPLVTREISNALNGKEDKDSESIGGETKNLEAAGKEAEKAKDINIKPSSTSDASKLVPGASGESNTQKVPTLNIGGLIPNDQKIPGFNLGGLISEQSKIPGFNLGGLLSRFDIGGLIPNDQKIPGFNLGGLISEQSKIPGFNLGGLLSRFDIGGINKSPKSGISPAMNVNRGIPITGAGQDDTLIAAKTGEAVLTKKDQKDIKEKYVHKDSGRPLDIPKYLSGRKPGTVSADKLKFRGGFFEGGMIERFNSGGVIGGNSYLPQASWERKENRGQDLEPNNGDSMSSPSVETRHKIFNPEINYSMPSMPPRNRRASNTSSIPSYEKGGSILSSIGNLFGRKDDKSKGKDKDGKNKGYQPKFLNPRARIIFDRLVRGGMTRVAAGGILANIGVETGYTYDPGQLQGGGGPGRGLVQWEKGGRYDADPINLVDFAKRRKKPWNDLNTQVDFILHELKEHPEYQKVRAKLNSQKDIREAVKIFLLDYEKAGEPHLDRRYEVANELMKEGYLKAPPNVAAPKPKGFFGTLGFPKFNAGGQVKELSKLNHSGYVKENSGLDYGTGSDRQAILAKPGEYVIPSRTVDSIGVKNIEKMVAATDSNSEAASKKGSLEFRNSQPQKMQAGGIVGKKFIGKASSKTRVNESLDYVKYFSSENLIDPVRLKKTIVEILTADSETKDYFSPRSIQRPEIKPYNQETKVTVLPPIESSNGNMASLMRGQGSKRAATPVPSFSAISPVNDRELNAKVYYGIE